MRTRRVPANKTRFPEPQAAAHELGERGADEPDLDLESLDRALG